MGYAFYYILAGTILLLLVSLTYKLEGIFKLFARKENEGQKEIWKEKLEYSKGFIYFGIVLTVLAILLIFYKQINGTVYEGHFKEWLNLIVRWMHITFGIAWIGASFYFVFLENALNRTKNLRDELAGNLWAVHCGGYYYLEKYKTSPEKIPS